MAITKYSTTAIVPRTNVYAEREMLKHAEPVVILGKMALNKQMPKNKTQTIEFRRPRTFDPATTPLTEGVTPASTIFGYDDVSVPLAQYGDWSELTDVIADLHEDQVGRDMSMMHGENVGRTMEALNWGVIRAGSNVIFSNGALRSAVNTPLTIAVQSRAVRALKNAKARKITRILDSSVNYGTVSVEGAYVAVAHTDLEDDIRGLTGFQTTADYGTRKTICDEEIGRVRDVRYVLSPDLDPFADAGGAKGSMVSTTGTSADVYPIIYMGQDAWGTVALRGQGAITPAFENPGKPTKDDPLGQRGFVSWKSYHAALILNQTWMVRAEVAATAV